jgi:lysozyme
MATSCFGIDVSKWQTSLPDLSSVDFMFARASIGTLPDERYEQHISEAKAAGIVTGAYHFNWDTLSIAAQVTTFIAAAGDVNLYALDVEGANAFSVAQSREFIRLMHEAGLKCGLYHSASGFFDAGQDFDWVAKWSSVPPASWDFWQYTSDGYLPGYAGRLDFDRFNGTLTELYAFAGIPTAPDSGTEAPVLVISDETPVYVDLPVGAQIYDGAGKPLVKVSVKQTQASPWEVEFTPNFHARIITIVTGGQNVQAYVHTSEVGVRPIPTQDCSDEIAADRAKARIVYT